MAAGSGATRDAAVQPAQVGVQIESGPTMLIRSGAPSFLVYPRGGRSPVDRSPTGARQLAEWTRISLSSASGHASELRRAGLISTRRDGRAVRHAVTDLGRDVLRGRHSGYGLDA